MDVMLPDTVTEKIINFVKGIGLQVKLASLDTPTFLPGIKIETGTILIDNEKLLYPGDILHEAGHLAVMPPGIRDTMTGDLDPESDLQVGGELMVIPWSYAAALYLQIDPAIVFHQNGYKGGSESILDNFKNGRYFGVPMLQWIGLSFEPHKAKELGIAGFPAMIKWLRE